MVVVCGGGGDIGGGWCKFGGSSGGGGAVWQRPYTFRNQHWSQLVLCLPAPTQLYTTLHFCLYIYLYKYLTLLHSYSLCFNPIHCTDLHISQSAYCMVHGALRWWWLWVAMTGRRRRGVELTKPPMSLLCYLWCLVYDGVWCSGAGWQELS